MRRSCVAPGDRLLCEFELCSPRICGGGYQLPNKNTLRAAGAAATEVLPPAQSTAYAVAFTNRRIEMHVLRRRGSDATPTPAAARITRSSYQVSARATSAEEVSTRATAATVATAPCPQAVLLVDLRRSPEFRRDFAAHDGIFLWPAKALGRAAARRRATTTEEVEYCGTGCRELAPAAACASVVSAITDSPRRIRLDVDRVDTFLTNARALSKSTTRWYVAVAITHHSRPSTPPPTTS